MNDVKVIEGFELSVFNANGVLCVDGMSAGAVADGGCNDGDSSEGTEGVV